MKWLPLKMNFLPLIFQEINFVTEEYISLLSKIRQKESEKESKKSQKAENNIRSSDESPSRKSNKNIEQTDSEFEVNKEKEKTETEKENEYDEEYEIIVKKFNGLRMSISKRINELEDFYEDNIEDVRVSNFEKARLRLKKLLMYSYDNINKVENSSHQKNIFIKDENNLFNKKITEDTKKKIIENNISLEKQIIKERTKEEERAKKKLLGSNEKQKKAVNKKEGVKNKKRVIKVRGDEGFLKPTEKARKSSVMIDSENMDFDFDEYNKSREIIFKIKLKEDEYKLLLKEKKNKGHISPYLFK
jgi:hypothetical protein